MTGLIALLLLIGQEPAPGVVSGTRPEPPMTEEQRRLDALNQPSEGERVATDGQTPDRLICDLRRLPGSNLRVRHCSSVEDRRRARSEAQSVMSYGGAPASSNR